MNDICLTVFRSRGDIGEGAREKLAKGAVSRAERKGGEEKAKQSGKFGLHDWTEAGLEEENHA